MLYTYVSFLGSLTSTMARVWLNSLFSDRLQKVDVIGSTAQVTLVLFHPNGKSWDSCCRWGSAMGSGGQGKEWNELWEEGKRHPSETIHHKGPYGPSTHPR